MLTSAAMVLRGWDRRQFLAAGSACLAVTRSALGQTPSLAHANVAELERARVLADAAKALAAPIAPVTAAKAPKGLPGVFFSEVEPDIRTAGGTDAPELFRAHAAALRQLSANVATLCAASVLTGDSRYATQAAEHVRASLLTSSSGFGAPFNTAGCVPGTLTGTPAGVVDLVPLAELARALSFLADGPAMNPEEWDAVRAWFKAATDWLNSNRAAGVARDSKDHRASSWLLIVAACARLQRDDNALEDARKLFRKPTLRNQIRPDGVFPQEVATPNPYRNTLFNFDLLTGACQLLNSPFDPLWSYELIDGVGLRTAAAYLYPVISHPERWGFVSDAVGFRDLPGRRPGMLFAGRAYDRPEYVESWLKAPPGPPPENIAASFPIREPLLWTARAPHGY